jgi:crotonobetainyl-CoA:carnitine CoA-transferase CaiB-like acyl-CoA transferase
VRARPQLLATLRERLASRSAAELATLFERAGLPFAPIRRPEDLFDDTHLNATGGLADVIVPDGAKAGQAVKTTLFPIALAGQRLGVRQHPPRFGADTDALLTELGYARGDIRRFRDQAIVA